LGKICNRFTSETYGYVTTVSLLKPPTGSRNGLKYPLGLLDSPMHLYNRFFKAEAMGVVIEMCIKYPGGRRSLYCTRLHNNEEGRNGRKASHYNAGAVCTAPGAQIRIWPTRVRTRNKWHDLKIEKGYAGPESWVVGWAYLTQKVRSPQHHAHLHRLQILCQKKWAPERGSLTDRGLFFVLAMFLYRGWHMEPSKPTWLRA
jgi:hypothetical protein